MTTEIRIEVADAVATELRASKDRHGLTWSEFAGALAAVDDPVGDVADAAAAASESATGHSSSAAAYGAALHVVGGAGDGRGDRGDGARSEPEPEPTPASTNGASPSASNGDGWDAGLSEPERETVEALAAAVDAHDGAVSVDQLDTQVPLAHMGDLRADDVTGPLADHPDVAEVSTGVFAPA